MRNWAFGIRNLDFFIPHSEFRIPHSEQFRCLSHNILNILQLPRPNSLASQFPGNRLRPHPPPPPRPNCWPPHPPATGPEKFPPFSPARQNLAFGPGGKKGGVFWAEP